jgi:hypothetical protein
VRSGRAARSGTVPRAPVAQWLIASRPRTCYAPATSRDSIDADGPDGGAYLQHRTSLGRAESDRPGLVEPTHNPSVAGSSPARPTTFSPTRPHRVYVLLRPMVS